MGYRCGCDNIMLNKYGQAAKQGHFRSSELKLDQENEEDLLLE